MFSRKIKTVVLIDGMSCEHCANKVKTTIDQIEHVKKVKVDLSKKQVTITSSEKIDINKLKEQIENLDYRVMNITEEEV